MENITERLIEIVKNHNILYDLSHPLYKNVREKNKVWDEIGTQLQMNGENAKKKFKNLRDSYAKHLRTEKTHTGQEAKATNKYKMWPWVQQMSYFKQFLQFAKTESNIHHIIENEENNDETPIIDKNIFDCTTTTEEQDSSSNVPSRKRKLTSKKTFEENISSVDKVLNYLKENEGMNANTDELDLLCLSYAKTMRTFNPRLQTITKFKVAKIIMEAELEQQADSSRITHSQSLSFNSQLQNESDNFGVS